jgi:hypothetical protein
LFIGTNTCFKKYLEKSKRLFVRKTYTTSCKLAVAGFLVWKLSFLKK